MDIVGYDPFMDAVAAEQIVSGLRFVTDLDDLYEASDYITIHVPATDQTRGMIDAAAIGKMRDGVVFLNFSRDALVNDPDMAAALESGKVLRYVSDFANPAVVKMPNAIVLPHLGASTAEAEDNCAIMAVNEVMNYLTTGEKVNCVNL